MGDARRLRRYRQKRDFSRTGEPSGDDRTTPDGEQPRFTIQHHLASSEHYDVRLEHDGVLVSWAVPKGPSTDPRDKRLAVRTEDHPFDYVDFEGTIPEGEYGAGTVIVWDTGTWENTTLDRRGNPVDAGTAIDRGYLTFDVRGHKLHGGYVLQRFRPQDDQWLLIKQSGEGADARRRPTSTQPWSVLSGRAAADLGEEES